MLWLATWMIHNANHIRPNENGLKVGGHQASSASLATITKPVRALAVSQVGATRSVLEQLQAGYFFEACLSDKLYFRPRASSPVATIPFVDLAAGIDKLAAGAYYDAPRVCRGFRVLLADECIAANADFDDTEYMLIADAKKAGRMVIPCSCCDKPAQRIDELWPYQWDRNRCMQHMGLSAAAGGAPRLKVVSG